MLKGATTEVVETEIAAIKSENEKHLLERQRELLHKQKKHRNKLTRQSET